MFARDIMNKCLSICTGETPLMEAYQLMLDHEHAFVSVVEDNVHKNPIGVITEHDICLQVIGKGRNPRNLTAAGVMNAAIIKTSETSTLIRCRQLLDGNKSKKIFVIDDRGALCGYLTFNGIEKYGYEQRSDNLNRSAFLGEYRSAGLNRIF